MELGNVACYNIFHGNRDRVAIDLRRCKKGKRVVRWEIVQGLMDDFEICQRRREKERIELTKEKCARFILTYYHEMYEILVGFCSF